MQPGALALSRTGQEADVWLTTSDVGKEKARRLQTPLAKQVSAEDWEETYLQYVVGPSLAGFVFGAKGTALPRPS
jgi:hypothetical protein